MTLHKRTLFIICITFLGLISALYATSQLIVLGGFSRQENSDTRQDVERVKSALDDNLSNLRGTARDWAYWDDTYAYVEDQNQVYFKSNLDGNTAISSNRLNVMAFVDTSGHLVYGKAYDIAKNVSAPFPRSLQAHLVPGDLLLSHLQESLDSNQVPGTTDSNPATHNTQYAITSGIILLPEGPMLIVSAPILTSAITGPPHGTLLFGRYLNTAEITRLSRTTLFSLTAHSINDPSMDPDFKIALTHLSDDSPIDVQPFTSDSIAGYTLLNDIYGKPALIVRAIAPRGVYAQGQSTVLYLMLALIVVGLVFAAVILVLMEKLVLSRLARLRRKVSAITASGDLSSRVPVTETDELASLALDINSMLTALDASQRERVASESRYGGLMEQASDGIAVYNLQGKIIQANPRACEMLGYTYEEMLSLSILDVVDPSDTEDTPIRFDELMQGEIVISDRLLVRKDGTCFPSEISAKLLSGQRAIQAMVRDVTDRKQAQEALRNEKDFSESLINSSVDGIIAFDRDCRYTVWNPSMERMTGFSLAHVLGKRAFDVFPFLLQIGQDKYFYAALEGKTVISSDRPYVIPETDKGGFYEGRYSPLHNREGDVIGGLAIISDVTESHTLQEQLAHQAFHDALTGLSNRALFMDRVSQALARSSRRDDSVAVLFLDLDDFKVMNDTLGHKAGDQLLIEMGERLKKCVRTSDTVARLGGDEFTVLLEDVTDLDAATLVAERIAEQLQSPFLLDGHEVFVTTSLGIAISTSDSTDPDDLLRDADVAMYEAKNKGKSRYAVFDPTMNVRAWKRLELEIEIRRGIDRGDFFLHYQPIVSLKTGRILEVEALVRWRHSTGRLMSPLEFIPVAEATGLIVPIGRWVLKEACRQVRAWHRLHPLDPPLMLSVNLSARQLRHPALVRDIVADLAEVDFDPAYLKLEITESVALDDTDTTIATLVELRSLGIHLTIDDFGTGYSALSYLKRLPIDTLKIDRSFIDGLGRDLEDTAIVRAVIAFAKTLSLTVTAESIETAEQLSHLQNLGCDCGQGFYFAKPLPQYELEALLGGTTLPIKSEAETRILTTAALVDPVAV